jgi:hypothetical protein
MENHIVTIQPTRDGLPLEQTQAMEILIAYPPLLHSVAWIMDFWV